MQTHNLLLAGFMAVAIGSTPVLAQESPTGTWGNSVTWRNANDRYTDLARAEAIQRERRGGATNNTTVTYEGEVNNYTTNEGPVTSNSSTNAVNLNSFTSNVKNEGNGSVGVKFTADSVSHQATQNAVAQSAAADGSASNSAASGQ